MSVAYRCAACDAHHASRVRAVSRRQFESFNEHLGNTLERCRRTGQWVTCTPEQRFWVDAVSDPGDRR